MKRSVLVPLLVSVLLLIAVARVLSTYSVTGETFDEPCHVAAAIELLDQHTYRLDPYNTPLARIFIGLPLYLSGSRMPQFAADDPSRNNYIDVGNKILHNGNFAHNLALARYGVLPLFFLAASVVFLWCRREFGDMAAVVSILLFTTVPTILAFSSIAYSDMATAFAQPAALFAFTLWLESPNRKTSIWLGVTFGLALLAKFTSLIYVPAGVVAILLVRFLWSRKTSERSNSVTAHAPKAGKRILQLAAASLIAMFVVWGGYLFSSGPLQQSMGLSPSSLPSFQHFPAVLRPAIRGIILKNPTLPAPWLIEGIADSYAFNKDAPPSYFMGQVKHGGWWYFFIFDLALKAPPAFLILGTVGMIALLAHRELPWTALSPAAPIIAILLATTTTKVYYGVRHIIIVFALLAIVGGYGASYLWQVQGRRRLAARALLCGLLVWQIASSVSAGRDFLAYFNFMAGSDPSRIFVTGCDLDCGQDLPLLSEELRARKISHVTLALWTAADMTQTDLPAFDVARPSKPVGGWFAVSLRSLRTGTVFHENYPQNAFDWLSQYQPVQHIGKSILLYKLPEGTIFPEQMKAEQQTGLPR